VRSVPKLSAGTAVPAQCTWFAGSLTCAVGFTVIVKVWAVPEQLTLPFVNVGVTVIVALIGAVPALVAVKAGRLPAVGPAPRPMAVLELVHE
jgi:hypothetical protein